MGFDFAFGADDVLPESVTRYVDFTVDASVDPFPDDGWEPCDACGRERDLRPLLKEHDETGEIVRQHVCEDCQAKLVDEKADLIEWERISSDPDTTVDPDPADVPESVAEAARAVEDGADPEDALADIDPADLVENRDPVAEMEGTPTGSPDLEADGGE